MGINQGMSMDVVVHLVESVAGKFHYYRLKQDDVSDGQTSCTQPLDWLLNMDILI